VSGSKLPHSKASFGSPLKWQSLKSVNWNEQLGPAQSAKGQRWEEVFKEHPEFFRLEDTPEKVTIRWRFAYDKNFDARKGKEYTSEEMGKLTDEDKENLDLTRKPMSTDEIKALIDTAMELYSRAFLGTTGIEVVGSDCVQFFRRNTWRSSGSHLEALARLWQISRGARIKVGFLCYPKMSVPR